LAEIQKLKDAILQLKKNKESTLAESVRIEHELPDLENKVEILVKDK